MKLIARRHGGILITETRNKGLVRSAYFKIKIYTTVGNDFVLKIRFKPCQCLHFPVVKNMKL